ENKATQESDKHEIDEIKDNKSNGGDRRKGDRRGTMAKELSEEVDTKGMLSKSDTVRVTIKKLDELLNLVGELAITNSGFVEISDRFHSMLGNKDIVTEFKGKIDQLSNIAKNLQEGIMQSRMVPIGSVFSRFTRLVRDLSKDLDKNVSISFKGEETELDKKIIDVIGDPLIHLIRNSIDHGLESTEERRKSGKNETGKILLNAYQSGNHIYVEVSDDGQGLNKERILNKAIDKKLVSEDQAQHLSENDIYNIVFLPGFSTKEKVTAVSGRGVGMDVVMDTVKSLNGTVSVRSKRGEGSVFTLSFPLTLAIVPAILTECSFEVYAIPLSNVVETIKVEIKEIQTVDFQEVIRLRNQVIPILRLNDTFEIKSDNSSKRISIVISDFEDQQIGIVVDKLIGKREIVIKTLSQNYKEMRGISGATILGNGQIALILDIPRLIELNRETGQHSRRNIMKKKNFDQIALNRQSGLMDFKVGYDESEIKNKILAEFEMDDYTYKLVKEIFKTALATSSNSIKRFLNKDIILAVPDIEVHQFEKIKNISKFIDEEKMFFSEVDLTEALHGKVIIEMDEAGMMKLFKEFVGNQPIKSSVGESCIMEIGNLITAGITNTISRALGIKTYPSAPSFHYDSHKNYFEKLFDEHHKINNYIWMIDTDIIVDRVVVKGKVYVFPYDRSFKEIGMLVREKKDIFSFMVTA
ncbi:MAG: chemotaxis protein CheW, partial [Spirochaetota bacterium]|nr:chemotaxis protein CheW [Spirochaetota bacterium]